MNTKGLKWEGDSMFKRFYPDTIQESTYDIDFKALQQQGIKGVLFDIDNTLVEHGADATPRAIALFDELKKMGMKSCLTRKSAQSIFMMHINRLEKIIKRQWSLWEPICQIQFL